MEAKPRAQSMRGKRIEMAVSFLRAHPEHRASDDDMRKALGLHPLDPPQSWLASGINDGKLEFDGATWTLGPRSINSAKIADRLIRAALYFIPRLDGSLDLTRGGKVVARLTPNEVALAARYFKGEAV